MASIIHSVTLSEDRKTVRLVLMRDGGEGLCDDLAPADVDLLVEALSELREQMIEE